jgi:hypothetical protein
MEGVIPSSCPGAALTGLQLADIRQGLRPPSDSALRRFVPLILQIARASEPWATGLASQAQALRAVRSLNARPYGPLTFIPISGHPSPFRGSFTLVAVSLGVMGRRQPPFRICGGWLGLPIRSVLAHRAALGLCPAMCYGRDQPGRVGNFPLWECVLRQLCTAA